MKFTKLYILVVGLMFGFNLSAQVEDEVEFLYMKAKYLYDTDRHEDAVNAFNKVIKKDETYQDALVLRGASKFGLAAYKGAMNDFEKSIEVRGITKDVVGWAALTYYKMDKIEQAESTLETALLVDSKNRTLWTLKGDIAMENGEKMKACDSYEKAANLGDSKAERKLASNCGGSTTGKTKTKKTKKPKNGRKVFNQGKLDTSSSEVEVKEEEEEQTGLGDEVISLGEKEEEEEDNGSTNREDEDTEEEDEGNGLGDEVISLGDKEDEEEANERPEFDPNRKEVIEIDEDLTLEIYGEGLGNRKILDQPNILILAEEDGVVAIDICVGRTGSVKSAEYNDDLSTIRKQSLISLAIRKAKEFWFAKDRQKEACGVILYKIKGS